MNDVFKRMLCFILLILSISNPLPIYAHNGEELNIESEAAILIDATTGTVLFEKNSNQEMYPASITKIVTAIIAIEEGNLSDQVTIGENPPLVEGTRVYLAEGESLPLLQLVQGMLINSGNDAAIAIAEHLSGSEEAFAKRMNQFVQEKIGVTNTHFTNASGLFDPDHITTAYDMAKIAQYAMQNETFREIVGTRFLPWKSKEWETTLVNHNKLIPEYEGVTGIKNGYVSKSGFTLVGSAKRGETEFIGVILKANSPEQQYGDMKKLLDYGFDHFETRSIPGDQVFYNSHHEPYKLEETLSYTAKIDEKVSVTVKGDSTLTVTGEDQRVLLSYPLNSIAEKNNVQSAALHEEAKQSVPIGIFIIRIILLLITTVYFAFLLLIGYMANKKYLSK